MIAIVERGQVTRFIAETHWQPPWRSPTPSTGNRLVTMRMRDQRRWLYRYREEMLQLALEEAKRAPLRTFLRSVFFAVNYASEVGKRLP